MIITVLHGVKRKMIVMAANDIKRRARRYDIHSCK